MVLRLYSILRVSHQMPQRAKLKKASFLATNGNTKLASREGKQEKTKDVTHLPELSDGRGSVAASKPKIKSLQEYGTTTSSLAAIRQRPVQRKGKNHAVSKSYSDTLLSKFSGLSIRTSSQKTKGGQVPGRRYLSTFNVSNLNEIAELIRDEKVKNIIVMAGAGISTPSGIPDFRSPGTGLYDNLHDYNLPDPAAVFDIDFFRYNPKPFFQLAKDIYPGNYLPNSVHYFARMLHEKKLLLKMYTQNIDALERAAGIPESKLVEAHGSFATATCRRCKAHYQGAEILEDVMNQNVPVCRKNGCKGVIKPDIVFFGEDLPRKFFEYPKHFAKCDLLIVLGTSLEVHPFAGLVDEVSRSTPRLLINRDVVGPFVRRKRRLNDVVVKGDIVEGVDKLVELLQWTHDIEELMNNEGVCSMVRGESESVSNPQTNSLTSEASLKVSEMSKQELGLFRLGIKSEHCDGNK